MNANPYTDLITRGDPIQWRERTWTPVTEAITPDEMFAYLRATVWPYDSESARQHSTGGTFDITFNRTFTTMTVANAHAGLVRLYRATDIRELRDGRTW